MDSSHQRTGTGVQISTGTILTKEEMPGRLKLAHGHMEALIGTLIDATGKDTSMFIQEERLGKGPESLQFWGT
jgi:hypothetical protein